MTDKPQTDGPARPVLGGKAQAAAEERRRRKAALLRENLMKRKAQSRERPPDGDGAGPAGRDSEK